MKSKNQNIHHINKNMMNALANLSITMCHAFIQDKDENLQVNIIVSNDH
jgi:hypothetical protein